MLLLGLVWRRLTLAGAVSGLVVGVGVVCALVFSGNDPVWGTNAGIVALAGNLVVALGVSKYGPRDRDARSDAEVPASDPGPDVAVDAGADEGAGAGAGADEGAAAKV